MNKPTVFHVRYIVIVTANNMTLNTWTKLMTEKKADFDQLNM